MRVFFTVLFIAGGCSAVPPPPSAPPPSAAPPSTSASSDNTSPSAASPSALAPRPRCSTTPIEIGRLKDVELNEISGVAESTKRSEVLFVHNDSGDSPRFFAINRAGDILAELTLESVPLLIDAEDITVGRGPGGASFIYLGDTGNNFASMGWGIPRRKAVLYRIPEPEIPTSARHLKIPVREAFPIVFTFPRGARDVEAFFIEPQSGDLFMIGKQPDGHSQVLTASAGMLAAGGGELTLLGELRFGKEPLSGSPMPTSASISKDGKSILVRTYSSVFLFHRAAGEPVLTALSKAPLSLASPQESQGEAIGWVDQDAAFVTISEGVKPAINCVAIPR